MYKKDLNEGLSDKIKSRAKKQEIQLQQYIDNIDINSYFEDSPTIKEENYVKLKELLFNFPNKELIYKILKDTDKKYRKQINYLFEEFEYIIGEKEIKEFIIHFINEMKDDLNEYSINKISQRILWSYLDDELILNELKKYKDSKLVDEIYNKNYEYYREEEFEELNENFESRQEQFKIFAKKVTEKMGIPEPQYLDSGFFGSAFIIDNDRILKITTDKSEALNANKIKNKTTHFIAKVFDVRGFKFENKDYFFIILEKVKTDFEFLYGIIENLIYWFDENYDEDFVTYISEGEFNDLKKLEIELYNDNKQLYNFFTNFVELKKELIKYNITSADFINASNLGFRGKRVVAFDLGISDDEGDIENVDLFEGLNLKSRANDQEKQRNYYVNQIIKNKNLEELINKEISDLKRLIPTDEFDNLIIGFLKTNFDNHFSGDDEYESKIDKDIFNVGKLTLKFKPRNNLSNKINITVGFDILNNKLYSHKFDGIAVDSGKYFDNMKELVDYVIKNHRKGVYESLSLKSFADRQEEQRNDYIRKEGINDYTITFLYGKNHNDLPKDIQSMIFSFYENLMENLMRSDDNHWQRRVLSNEISRDIFKLLPDEFKSDIIDLRIDTDMGLDKYHFDSSSNEQRDRYLNKAKEYRKMYSWEEKYLDSLNVN